MWHQVESAGIIMRRCRGLSLIGGVATLCYRLLGHVDMGAAVCMFCEVSVGCSLSLRCFVVVHGVSNAVGRFGV